MKDKTVAFENEFEKFSGCILNNSWYVADTDEILEGDYDHSSRWEDTLLLMDTLIKLLEKRKITGELIIIQAMYSLSQSQNLDTSIPLYKETVEEYRNSGSICAFPLKIAPPLNRAEFFQKSIWHDNPKYHSNKLFTYYRCTGYCTGDSLDESNCNEYSRAIVRFYSQKSTIGNSPGFLLL